MTFFIPFVHLQSSIGWGHHHSHTAVHSLVEYNRVKWPVYPIFQVCKNGGGCVCGGGGALSHWPTSSNPIGGLSRTHSTSLKREGESLQCWWPVLYWMHLITETSAGDPVERLSCIAIITIITIIIGGHNLIGGCIYKAQIILATLLLYLYNITTCMEFYMKHWFYITLNLCENRLVFLPYFKHYFSFFFSKPMLMPSHYFITILYLLEYYFSLLLLFYAYFNATLYLNFFLYQK